MKIVKSLLISCAVAVCVPTAASATPVTGILQNLDPTWSGNCTVSPRPYSFDFISTPGEPCTASRGIALPLSIRATLTSLRAAVFTEGAFTDWATSVAGLGEAPMTSTGADEYHYGAQLTPAQVEGAMQPGDILPVDVRGTAASSTLHANGARTGVEVAYDDVTPPEIVRIEGLPSRIEYTGWDSLPAVVVVFKDDGPYPLENADTSPRYAAFTSRFSSRPARQMRFRGSSRWDSRTEYKAEAIGNLDLVPGVQSATFSVADSVGHVTTKTVQVTLVQKAIKPRPKPPRLTGKLRVGTSATCTSTTTYGTDGGDGSGKTTWRWKRNGRLIPRATGHTLTLKQSMLGVRLSCVQTVTNKVGVGVATSRPRVVTAARR